jgi:hypothetical protein
MSIRLLYLCSLFGARQDHSEFICIHIFCTWQHDVVLLYSPKSLFYVQGNVTRSSRGWNVDSSSGGATNHHHDNNANNDDFQFGENDDDFDDGDGDEKPQSATPPHQRSGAKRYARKVERKGNKKGRKERLCHSSSFTNPN